MSQALDISLIFYPYTHCHRLKERKKIKNFNVIKRKQFFTTTNDGGEGVE